MLGGSGEEKALVRGNWHRKTLMLQYNPLQAIKIRRSLNKIITVIGLAAPSTWIPMLVIPLFMLISEQARHRRAHEHEHGSAECCGIVHNWSINLKNETNTFEFDIQITSNQVSGCRNFTTHKEITWRRNCRGSPQKPQQLDFPEGTFTGSSHA